MSTNETKILEFEEFIKSKGPWDLWASVTFHERTELAQARGSFKYFLKHLNSPDDIFFDKFVFCFVCFERESRGGVHIHALIRGIHPLYALKFQRKCWKFGNSKVKPYNPCLERNATRYLANKYVSRNLVDFDFMKVNSKFRNQSFCSPMHSVQI